MAYRLGIHLFRRRGQPTQSPSSELSPIERSQDDLKRRFPWRTLTSLLLALLAQSLLETLPLNPVRHPWLGILLYGMAVLLIVQAWRMGEIELTPLPAAEYRTDPLTARWGVAILSLAVLLLSFILFKGGQFNLTNLAVWLVGLGLLVWAFWETTPGGESFRNKLQRFISPLSGKSKLTRWVMLVLFVFGIVVFFRVYRLAEVPPEPFSDHAEKLLDVYDVMNGQMSIFFPRNTGREAIQFYLTAVVSVLFGTGISFMSLKIGTTLAGLATLPFIYFLGKEFGGKRTGLFALLLMGISYWGNIISRIGLRYTLYPLFAAATLYFLLRGLRESSRNDIIIAGLLLGAGLHGYTAFRIMPFVITIAFLLYWLHSQSHGARMQSLFWFGLVVLTALMVFLPLLRYTLENPDVVAYRSLTRLTGIEREITLPIWRIFLYNLGQAMTLFNWNNGNVWAHSVMGRPALDLISAALLIPGVTLVLARYIRKRDWRDIFLLLSIPLLLMPSILSLAFPKENPALNRTSAAMIPVFIIVALFLEALASSIQQGWQKQSRKIFAWSLIALLITFSIWQNYDLVFRQYDQQYRTFDWNSTEIGQLVQDFKNSGNPISHVFIVEYPYWVDSRLVAIAAGSPTVDPAIKRDLLPGTINTPLPKMFILNQDDRSSLDILTLLYPQGTLNRYTSDTARHDFLVYTVAANVRKP